jgi:multicomponent Na+:H+ antiporter subunit E
MTMFLWNLLLAFAWTLLTADFSLPNLGFGVVMSYLILRLAQPVIGDSPYFGKVFQVIGFLGFFLLQLVKSNLRVAHDVMTRTHYMRPGVIGIPLEAKRDLEITILANLITLTPGTLSLDVSSDRSTLYIHAMYIDDLDALRAELKELERRVLDILHS